MTTATRITLALALLAPAFPSAGRFSDAAQAFTLGVLRRDGHVIPFAAYDGKSWSSPWPAITQFAELPISIDDVPEQWWGKGGRPRDMTLWADGLNRGSLRPDGLVMRPTTCSSRFSLHTSYRPADGVVPPPVEHPYPKDGLVIWGGEQQIAAIEVVPPASKAWADISMAVLKPVNIAENQAIGAINNWKHPVPRAVRTTVPLELETLYRAPVDADGWTTYYVEVVRKYRPGPEDDGCGLITFASGWIMAGPDGKWGSRLTARIVYCDRKGLSYFFPLGLIRIGERAYWVHQASGYDQEHYIVTDTGKHRAEHVAVYSAGVCDPMMMLRGRRISGRQ